MMLVVWLIEIMKLFLVLVLGEGVRVVGRGMRRRDRGRRVIVSGARDRVFCQGVNDSMMKRLVLVVGYDGVSGKVFFFVDALVV